MTALHLAVQGGHQAVAEALLDKGANPNAVRNDGLGLGSVVLAASLCKLHKVAGKRS